MALGVNSLGVNLNKSDWARLDAELKRIDEDRWLSSRYAKAGQRRGLIALYLLCHELSRIQGLVSETMLGAIRFQWWREALDPEHAEYPRPHDTIKALAFCVETGVFDSAALQRLVDRYESAYEQSNRSAEPDGTIAAMAAQILAPAHGWSTYLREVARHVAALNRGEQVGPGSVVPKVPSGIRPAVAHFRLRWPVGSGEAPSRFQKRFLILRSILGGRV